MSTNIKILTPTEIKSFDLPPSMNAMDRKQLFRTNKSSADIVASFRSVTNKVCFIVQLGYFKATHKFFKAENFRQSEIDFVCADLAANADYVHLQDYDATTLERHQRVILDLLGYSKFFEQTKELLFKEALSLCAGQIKPKEILKKLIDFLKNNKIEVPSYFILAQIITRALNEHEDSLVATLEEALTPKDRRLLDTLMQCYNPNLKSLDYKLTDLKKFYHSLRPRKIKGNIENLIVFKELYEELGHVIALLGLNVMTVQYYAELVTKSTMFQMFQRQRNRHLLLICFIMHRYYSLTDLLVEAMILSAQSAQNTALKDQNEFFIKEHAKRNTIIKRILEQTKIFTVNQSDLEDILFNETLTFEKRIKAMQALVIKQRESKKISIIDEVNKNEADLLRLKEDHHFTFLEKNFIPLHNRISGIVKNICFDKASSDKKILRAIDYFKAKDGAVNSDAPLDFLKPDEKEAVINDNKKFRSALYTSLLFLKTATAIKSGALNLLYSYKHRSFNKSLIDEKVWVKSKDDLIERAGLSEFKDFNTVINNIGRQIDTGFEITNRNILDQKNLFVRFGPNNSLIVKTPPIKEKEISDEQVAELFPQDRFVTLYEILSSVNNAVPFADCFEHLKIKSHLERPDNKIIFAGIMGLGCNLGIGKIARISNYIRQNTLESTVNWRFSEENINNANNMVVGVINKLSLPRLYQKNPEIVHTSSDGQKFGVAVDSIHAHRSYKYFGQGFGLTDYSFNNEKHVVFDSETITSSIREATYVMDGLNNPEIEDSDMHSTDTHGFTEIVFGGIHFMKKIFAPRIKDFRKQRLYSIKPRLLYKNLGYKILPDNKIDTKSIEDQWDNILRLMATIKLKHAKASKLFPRLSSYSRQHPLYRAIKNFGKLIKTIFLLRYIDSVELRQDIEKQLNKTESIHKLAKAVFFGSNQEFQQADKEDHVRANGCKRLIENVIICWNYLYLSDLIHRTESLTERERIINIIKNGSIVVWQHINLSGEYNFSDDVLKNSFNFSLPKLMALEVA